MYRNFTLKKLDRQKSILLIAISLFFTFIPMSVDYIPLVPKPLGYYVLFILIFSLSLKFINDMHFFRFDSNMLILFLYYILFIYCFTSALWSDFPQEVAWRASITFLPGILVGLIILNDNKIDITVSKFLYYQMFIGLLLSIIAITLFFSSPVYWNPQGYLYNIVNFGAFKLGQVILTSSNIMRLSSITGNPNIFGYLLFLSLSSTFTLLYNKKSNKLYLGLAFIVQFIALILTYSRTSIAVTLLFLLMYTILMLPVTKGYSKKVFTYFIAFISFIILIMIPLIILLNGQHNQRLSLDLAGRTKGWSILIGNFQQNPILGSGFGTSSEILNAGKVDMNHAHSMYIGLMSELGLLGIFIMLVFAFVILITTISTIYPFNNKFIKNNNYAIYISVTLQMLLILVHQLFEFHLFRITYLNFIWLIMLFFVITLRKKILNQW
jgi:O-antigen ligase